MSGVSKDRNWPRGLNSREDGGELWATIGKGLAMVSSSCLGLLVVTAGQPTFRVPVPKHVFQPLTWLISPECCPRPSGSQLWP